MTVGGGVEDMLAVTRIDHLSRNIQIGAAGGDHRPLLTDRGDRAAGVDPCDLVAVGVVVGGKEACQVCLRAILINQPAVQHVSVGIQLHEAVIILGLLCDVCKRDDDGMFISYPCAGDLWYDAEIMSIRRRRADEQHAYEGESTRARLIFRSHFEQPFHSI